MSVLVLHAASASPPRGSTVGARRASLLDFDEAGAALVEVQDTIVASLPSSEAGQHQHEGSSSGYLSSSSSSSPPTSHKNKKNPPLFSLRNWFAPRPTQAASPSSLSASKSSAATSRTCRALGMTSPSSGASASGTVTSTSLGSLSAAATLCAEPLPSLVAPVDVDMPATMLHPNLEERMEWQEPSAIAPSPPITTTAATTTTPGAVAASGALLADKPAAESVHLQLTGLAPDPPPPTPADSRHGNNQTVTTTTVRVHSVEHEGRTYVALNTPRHKFASFLLYLNVPVTATDASTIAKIRTQRVAYDANVRQEWRELWKRRQLLTDRTELLAVYPSDSKPSAEPPKEKTSSSSPGAAPSTCAAGKRGGFADLLHLYTERFAGILADERQLLQLQGKGVLSWLQDNYGYEATRQLHADAFQQRTEAEQVQSLQAFLEWFRSRFPYFYDRCGSCGASMKDDLAKFHHNNHHDNSPVPPVVEGAVDDNDDDDDVAVLCQDDSTEGAPAQDDEEEEDDVEESSEYQTFIGYIYPNDDELVGKASRTELYRCHVCNDFTRFPRFNSVWHVLEQRRGRCGEYSMLLYRFLRALNHPCRWVVDWSDHVWAEIRIGTRWVHLDPCEAAVDQNLLYQGWGKKQTYILGFAAPPSDDVARGDFGFPLIQDITSTYTSDSWETICQRRDESETEISDSIEKAVADLRQKLPTAAAEPLRV